MVYYKLILNDKRQTLDQVYSIVVRVTYRKTNTTFNTGVRIHLTGWDEKQRIIKPIVPNYLDLNSKITAFYLRLQKLVLRVEEEGDFSLEKLREALNSTSLPAKKGNCSSVKQFVEQVISELKDSNKAGNALIYQTAWNRFSSFSTNKQMKFKDIDYTLLESFKRQLLIDGVKVNTVSNYLRTLRAIYNKAIKAKLVDRSSYPFIDVAIKSERTSKRAIPLTDVAKLLRLTLKPESPVWHSRNYFVLSISLIGISFTDLAYLKPTNIRQGRLNYRRRKTHKDYSIKLSPIARSIIELYSGRNSKYLLPILPASVVEDSLMAHKLIKQFIKTTNKYLKRMADELKVDPITTYVARHTWATTAKRMGYSNELIAEALGHEYGNKITNIYLDSFEPSVIDEVNVKVLEALQ
jgi:integrase/recombinase XerD